MTRTATLRHHGLSALKAAILVLALMLGLQPPVGHAASAAVIPDLSGSASEPTPYGPVGLWLLLDDQPSIWNGIGVLGIPDIYQPVNVIITDPYATTPEEATARLQAYLANAGFPAQTGHSTGYQALIDGHAYEQQPGDDTNSAFSNGSYLFDNDHGRVFGAQPLPGGGYVWTAAFSSEVPGLEYPGSLYHEYVSFNRARDNLRDALTAIGAGDIGTIQLGSVVHTPTQSTGDADGNAIIVELPYQPVVATFAQDLVAVAQLPITSIRTAFTVLQQTVDEEARVAAGIVTALRTQHPEYLPVLAANLAIIAADGLVKVPVAVATTNLYAVERLVNHVSPQQVQAFQQALHQALPSLLPATVPGITPVPVPQSPPSTAAAQSTVPTEHVVTDIKRTHPEVRPRERMHTATARPEATHATNTSPSRTRHARTENRHASAHRR